MCGVCAYTAQTIELCMYAECILIKYKKYNDEEVEFRKAVCSAHMHDSQMS